MPMKTHARACVATRVTSAPRKLTLQPLEPAGTGVKAPLEKEADSMPSMRARELKNAAERSRPQVGREIKHVDAERQADKKAGWVKYRDSEEAQLKEQHVVVSSLGRRFLSPRRHGAPDKHAEEMDVISPAHNKAAEPGEVIEKAPLEDNKQQENIVGVNGTSTATPDMTTETNPAQGTNC